MTGINAPVVQYINALNYDEIKQYVFTRHVCTPEAMYRIYKFKLHNPSHVIPTAERNNVESRGPVEEHRILVHGQRMSYITGW